MNCKVGNNEALAAERTPYAFENSNGNEYENVPAPVVVLIAEYEGRLVATLLPLSSPNDPPYRFTKLEIL